MSLNGTTRQAAFLERGQGTAGHGRSIAEVRQGYGTERKTLAVSGGKLMADWIAAAGGKESAITMMTMRGDDNAW